jgi:hypothetical protein
MRKKLMVSLAGLFLLSACTPRDFLTRRLATDLISASEPFRAAQQFPLQTGTVANKDYMSPEYIVLQQHGWITANKASCPPTQTPPCWEVLLTPSGVDTVRSLVPAQEADKSLLFIPVAKRELLAVSGISKQGNLADVDFQWRWVPLNEVGSALYSSDVHYISTVGFRDYDDGWRLAQSSPHSGQSIDDAIKNAEPAQ